MLDVAETIIHSALARTGGTVLRRFPESSAGLRVGSSRAWLTPRRKGCVHPLRWAESIYTIGYHQDLAWNRAFRPMLYQILHRKIGAARCAAHR
jgi:hypothetical protein